MACVDAKQFERLKKVNQKYKNIVFGYLRDQQVNLLEDDEIPALVQSTILLFYYQSLESSILSDTECDKLLTMFDEQNKFKEFGHHSFELIYSSKRDGDGIDNFSSKCEDKPNLLCLIHESKGNVFGGYTKRGWKSDGIHDSLEDKDAFIFSIRSNINYPPKIFNCTVEKKALYYQWPSYYCMFGADCAIYIQQDGLKGGCNDRSSKYYEKYPQDFYLTGTCSHRNRFSVIAVEVFQLKTDIDM